MTSRGSGGNGEVPRQYIASFPVGANASGAQRTVLQRNAANTFASACDPNTMANQFQNQYHDINDWECVVKMYFYGQGTADGIPLRDIEKYSRSNGQVKTRKMLEKQRSIGETYEHLGKELFESAIGYQKHRITGRKRKLRVYEALERCRVVKRMRKLHHEIPADGEELSRMIDLRISEKHLTISVPLDFGI